MASGDQVASGKFRVCVMDWNLGKEEVPENFEGYDVSEFEQAQALQRQLDQELEMIQEEYLKLPAELRRADFKPLSLAVELITSPNSEKKHAALQYQRKLMDAALETIVEGYYRGFNKSITNFSHILGSMTDTQDRVRSLKSSLLKTKRLLHTRNTDLRHLWQQSLQYKEMLRILDKIEEVRQVPQDLDDLLLQRQFLHAARLLSHVVKMLHSNDLLGVGALMEIRVDLVDRKNNFHVVLIEELCNFLYARGAFSNIVSSSETDRDSSKKKQKWELDRDRLPVFDSQKSGSVSSEGSERAKSHQIRHSIATWDRPKGHERKSSLPKQSSVPGGVSKKSSLNERTKTRHRRANSISAQISSKFSEERNPSRNSNNYDYDVEGVIDPEMEPQRYVVSLLEALVELDCIPSFVGTVTQHMPGELSTATTKTSVDVFDTFASRGYNKLSVSHDILPTYDPAATSDPYMSSSTQDSKMPHSIHTEWIQRSQFVLSEMMSRLFRQYTGIMKRYIFMSDNLSRILIRRASQRVMSGQDRGWDQDSMGLSVTRMWNAIQAQLQHVICLHMNVNKADAADLMIDSLPYLSSTKSDSKEDTSTTLFSFSDVQTTEIKVDPMGSPWSSVGMKSIIGASPTISGGLGLGIHRPAPSSYHIVTLYRPLIFFDDEINELVGTKEKKVVVGGLRTFLDSTILTHFVPIVQRDFRARVSACLEHDKAFRPQQRTDVSTQDSRPLLQAVSHIAILVEELHEYASSLPLYVNEFIAIVEVAMLRLLDRCQENYAEISNHTQAAALLRQRNPDIKELLQMDPLWRACVIAQGPDTFSQGDTASSSSLPSMTSTTVPVDIDDSDMPEAEGFWEGEQALEADMYINPPSKSVLVNDIQKLALVSAISDSMDWLADEILRISTQAQRNEKRSSKADSSGPDSAGRALWRQSMALSKKSRRQQMKSHSGIVEKRKDRGSSQGSSGGRPPLQHDANIAITTNLEFLAKKCVRLSEQCLFFLRMELRVRCFCCLAGIRGASYDLEDEATEPDNFVSELNAVLASAEEAISSHVPPRKSRYLFGSLARLISSILIKSAPKIGKLNKNGVHKIMRNISALQQNMAQLSAGHDVHFERVRKYYELALLDQEALMQDCAEHTHGTFSFSLEEYIIALKFLDRHPDPQNVQMLEQIYHSTRGRQPGQNT